MLTDSHHRGRRVRCALALLHWLPRRALQLFEAQLQLSSITAYDWERVINKGGIV